MNLKNTYTPPYKRISFKALAVLLALLAAIAGGALAYHSHENASESFAADNALPIHYVDTLDDIPSGQVFLNNMTYSAVEITNKSPAVEIIETFWPNWQENSYVLRWYHTYTANQTNTLTNPFSITFTNAGYTDSGRLVNCVVKYNKVTITSSSNGTWFDIGIFNRNGSSPPTPFAFYFGNSNGLSWGTIDASISLTYADTGQPVTETAQLTFADLDGTDNNHSQYNEGIKLGAGFAQVYIMNSHVLDRDKIMSSGNRHFSSKLGQPQDDTNKDERYYMSSYMENGHGDVTWYGMNSWGSEIGSAYKGYPEWNAPEKKILNEGNLFGNTPITYEISQFLPYTASTNQAKSVLIEDTLPDIFDISETTVTMFRESDGNREDVTDKWNISIDSDTHKISAEAKSAYESLGQHYLIIETRIDSSRADLSRYLADGTESASESIRLIIENEAVTTINDKPKKSNKVESGAAAYPTIYDLNAPSDNASPFVSDSDDVYMSTEEASTNGYVGFHIAGEHVNLSDAVPECDGYVFRGWSEEKIAASIDEATYKALTEKIVDNVTQPAQTKTVYAVWSKKPTVKYIVDGIEIDSQLLTPGADGAEPFVPKKTGYIFSGWSFKATNVYEDKQVEATFEPISYHIIYDPNGGVGNIPGQSAKFDEDVVLSDNIGKDAGSEEMFTREHYELVSWNTEADGSGQDYSLGEITSNMTDVPNGTVTLYAQWRFYIQMPETGEDGLTWLWIIAGGMVSTGMLAVLVYRARRKP